MQREIREQPEILSSRAIPYLEQLQSHIGDLQPEMILLAARGSSDHAALYARYLIEVHLGIPAVLAAPSVLTRYRRSVRYPRCLAIGISQSGSAPDVSEVLEDVRNQGHATLAITNTPGSRITRAASATLLLDVGEERSVAATKTYTASLLALYQLTRALGAQLPDFRAPDGPWCDQTAQDASTHAGRIVQAETVFALGRGYSFSTASETALKLMECALIPCRAYSTADFEHGPKALAGPGSAVLAFDEISQTLRDQGGQVIQAPLPVVPEEQAPIWQALYGQWLALDCARLMRQNPDEPQFLAKVTRTR